MDVDGPVVIALDGSAHSAETLRWGMHEARLRGARVMLTQAYQEPHEVSEWAWYPFVAENMRLDERSREFLAGVLASERAANPGLQIESRLLHGPAVPLLREMSTAASLLVVGARGRSGRSGRGRIGSVGSHLAAHAHCPLALVITHPSDRPERPVVVGVDGSRTSAAAAREAAFEASLRGAALVVVHARPTIADPYGGGPPPVSGDGSDPEDPAHRGAREVADRLRAAYPDLEVQVRLVDDDPAHALLTAAEDAQLVVVGSRGLGGFRGMLLGSVSQEVVRRATTTVLVSREQVH